MSSKRLGSFLKWRRSDGARRRHHEGREDEVAVTVAAADAAIENELSKRAATGDPGAIRNLREWREGRAARDARRRSEERLRRTPVAERRPLADAHWGGPSYDLMIELGPRSDERLLAACVALWSHPSLDGPYLDPDREPSEQARVPPALTPWTPTDELSAADETGLSHLGVMYGLATLPDGNRVACVSLDFREVGLLRPAIQLKDELSFSIPMSALDDAYKIDWDASLSTNYESWRSWAAPLESWLADIAETIYRTVPFRLALLGEEVVPVMPSAIEVAAAGGPEQFGLVWASCLFPAEDGSLKWYPYPGWQ